MRTTLAGLVGSCLCVAAQLFPSHAKAADLQVVATIKPIHSLAAAVMAGVAAPRLLIDGAGSPHTFALKASDARTLNSADVIFRVSDSLEPFMAKVVKSLPRSVRVVPLMETPGLTMHDLRTGGTFEEHSHEKSSSHSGHKHGHGKSGHKHGDSDHAAHDGHIWLDPANAKLIADYIAKVLATEAPEHADRLMANAAALAERIDALSAELERDLRPLAGRGYVVFHDAYQYLEHAYGLRPVGSVTVSPDLMPSAKRLTELRRKISRLKATCVFAEPQFEPKLVATIIEGTSARAGTLDPLGASLSAGPELYFTLMRALAASLKACLGPTQ